MGKIEGMNTSPDQHHQLKISVIICTYNPVVEILWKVISALKSQSLPKDQWELILVDNNSAPAIAESIALNWHPNAKLVVETKAGLAHARLKGVSVAKTELIVFVDDDNLLEATYLERCLLFHAQNPSVGVFGGKSLPVFESEPPLWFKETGINLGCQDLGNELYISNYGLQHFKLTEYPKNAPIGTGMVIQKKAFLAYAHEVAHSKERLNLGRKGKSLTSGEDNDIILTVVKNGYEIAYLPELLVSHLIPKDRLSLAYFKKMAYESNRSWVKVLHLHQVLPWKKINRLTFIPRKIVSYFKMKAWKSELNTIKWFAACGLFKGLSEIE